MNTAHIYVLIDPRNGAVRYVGKANHPRARFRSHMLAIKKLHSAKWIQSLKALGFKPIMEVIETFPIEPAEVWQESERFYINYFRFLGFDLTNHIEGGWGSYKMSDESKLRCSLAQRGTIFSESRKAKMRANHWLNNGGKFSAETIEKIRAKSIGRKLSPEARAKIWEGRRREAAKRALTSQRLRRSG